MAETEMISWWPLWDVGVRVGAGQVGDGGREATTAREEESLNGRKR